jgi:hypothetical protein
MIPDDENFTDIALIEQYWMGQLQGEELQQFTLRLQTDAAFNREVMLQKSIMEQVKEVGRDDMRRELKQLHRQLGLQEISGLGETSRKERHFPFMAIAASVIIVLMATAVLYFSYFRSSDTTTAQVVQPLPAQQVKIRYKVTGGAPDMGFSGLEKDSLTTILLYPAIPGSPAYQFDDTLRLFGDFSTQKLSLQYDQSREQYTLFAGSIAYPLQQYQPRQPLAASSK